MPALRTGHEVTLTASASASCFGCRSTTTSAYWLTLRTVSDSVSPFCTEDVWMFRYTTDPPSFVIAAQKLEKVRVDSS